MHGRFAGLVNEGVVNPMRINEVLPRIAVSLLISGCSQPAETEPAADAGTPTADQMTTSPITVNGTRIVTHVAESNKLTPRAIDLSSATLEALVPNGDGYSVIAGTGSSNGSFSISGLSSGAPYYLHYYNPSDLSSHQYVLSSAANVDLGEYSGQRSSVVTGSSGTSLIWDDVGVIDAWSSSDQLLYYSSDVGLYIAGSTPAQGATTLKLSQSFVGAPLSSSARGDTLWVMQLHEVALSGSEVMQTLSRALALPAFDLNNATATTVSGTVASFSVPSMQAASLDFRRSQFAAFQDSARPAGQSQSANYSLYISAILGGDSLSYGFYTNSADLLAYSSTATSDVIIAGSSFGNPFPSSYGLIGDARANFFASYTVPGASSAVSIAATFGHTASLDSFMIAPITPQLGPVQDLQINGQSAYTTTAAVGTQPILSWSAPQLGTPSGYMISVHRLSIRSGTTRTMQTMVAQIQTTETRVVMPPGLLSSGEYYVFRVSSFARPGYDAARPFRFSFPADNAPTLTTMVTP